MPHLTRTAAASALALVFGVLGGACAQPPAPPTPTPTPPPPPLPLVTATATPTLIPFPTPVPTATVLARVPLRIGLELIPPRPQAGQEFLLRLGVTNTGDRPARGVYIATSGPWDRYTILSVSPVGKIARDANGWHIVSPVSVPPGLTTVLEVRARAEQPSDEQLTFAVREADPGELS